MLLFIDHLNSTGHFCNLPEKDKYGLNQSLSRLKSKPYLIVWMSILQNERVTLITCATATNAIELNNKIFYTFDKRTT